MPEAPGMFSTTIAWPSVRDTPSATRRAITSVAAPGPVGTISLIGRLGQVWAFAVVPSTTTAQHSNARNKAVTASHLVSWSRSGALREMGISSAAPRLSSSAKADDPVIAGREEKHGFGLKADLHLLLDARFRG